MVIHAKPCRRQAPGKHAPGTSAAAAMDAENVSTCMHGSSIACSDEGAWRKKWSMPASPGKLGTERATCNPHRMCAGYFSLVSSEGSVIMSSLADCGSEVLKCAFACGQTSIRLPFPSTDIVDLVRCQTLQDAAERARPEDHLPVLAVADFLQMPKLSSRLIEAFWQDSIRQHESLATLFSRVDGILIERLSDGLAERVWASAPHFRPGSGMGICMPDSGRERGGDIRIRSSVAVDVAALAMSMPPRARDAAMSTIREGTPHSIFLALNHLQTLHRVAGAGSVVHSVHIVAEAGTEDAQVRHAVRDAGVLSILRRAQVAVVIKRRFGVADISFPVLGDVTSIAIIGPAKVTIPSGTVADALARSVGTGAGRSRMWHFEGVHIESEQEHQLMIVLRDIGAFARPRAVCMHACSPVLVRSLLLALHRRGLREPCRIRITGMPDFACTGLAWPECARDVSIDDRVAWLCDVKGLRRIDVRCGDGMVCHARSVPADGSEMIEFSCDGRIPVATAERMVTWTRLVDMRMRLSSPEAMQILGCLPSVERVALRVYAGAQSALVLRWLLRRLTSGEMWGGVTVMALAFERPSVLGTHAWLANEVADYIRANDKIVIELCESAEADHQAAVAALAGAWKSRVRCARDPWSD